MANEILYPYTGDSDYIFLSYSHNSPDEAMDLVRHLQRDGYRVWYDEGIDPGTEYNDAIADKVKQCSFFIGLMNSHYLHSSYCKDELMFARKLEKKIVLVYTEDVELPEGLSMRMVRLQAIYKHRYDDQELFYQKLYTSSGISLCKDSVSASASDSTESIKQTSDSISAGREECQKIIEEINRHFGIDILNAAHDIGIASDNVHEIMTEIRTWKDPADLLRLLDAVKRRAGE